MTGGRRWLLLGPPLALTWALANIDKIGLSVFVTNRSFLHDMGLAGQHAQIGFLLSMFFVPYALCNLGWGFVVDRIGPRRSALASIVIWSLSMVAGGLSFGFGALLATRVALAAGEGALWSVSNKFTRVWFPPAERGRAQALYVVGQYGGPAIGAVLIVGLLHGGWRLAFVALGALSFVLLVPLFAVCTRDRPDQHPAVSAAEAEAIRRGNQELAERTDIANVDSLAEVLRRGRYWLAVFAFLANSILFFGLSSWLPSYLTDQRGFPAGLMATWTSIAWGLSLVVIVATTTLADRLQRAALLTAVGFACAAVAMYAGATAPTAQVAAPLMALGLAFSSVGSALGPVVWQRYAGPVTVGRATGIVIGIGNFVAGLAPAFIGLLIAAAGGAYLGAILFLVVAALAGCAAFAVLARDDRAGLAPAPSRAHVAGS